MRRLVRRVEQEGDQGLVPRGREQPSTRRIPAKVKAKGLKLYETRYGDLGPTGAGEKLAEHQGIPLSDETLRGWLLETGGDHVQRRKRPHRAWRERRAHVGELDGSIHDWFEGRGPRCVLMADIDDARSRVFARFEAYEGTIPAMDSFPGYIRQQGIPRAVYTDKPTTYRSPTEPTIEEPLAGARAPASVWARAGGAGCRTARGPFPQGKGRGERRFQTVQDRVIKELRLAEVATLDAADAFLKSSLPIYNRRFAVPPAQAADLHRPRLARGEPDRILCIKPT